LIPELENGAGIDSSGMTVAAFLERWIEHMQAQVSRPDRTSATRFQKSAAVGTPAARNWFLRGAENAATPSERS
jgi:hypothetical protein